jgi:hypothetical protein
MVRSRIERAPASDLPWLSVRSSGPYLAGTRRRVALLRMTLATTMEPPNS